MSPSTVTRWMKARHAILILLLAIVVGGVLRFYDLGTESLWLDEAYSIGHSSPNTISGVVSAAAEGNHPPLYFIILHFWMALLGTSEAAIRSLSAVFGIVSILLIYQVGSALFDRRVGLIGAFLSTISYSHIYYSQEARPYGLLLLLSLLSYYFFVKILREGSNRYYPCYFLANVLLGYTHLYGLLMIASQAVLSLLLWSRYRQQRLKLASTLAASGIALTPLVLLFSEKAVALAKGDFWIPKPEGSNIIYTLSEFSGPVDGQEPLLLLFLGLALTGLLAVTRLEGKWSWTDPLESLKTSRWAIRLQFLDEELLLIVWLSFPIVIPFVESQLMTPLYLTRYMIGASPAFYLLVARGMANITMKRLYYGIAAFILLLSTLGLHHYYSNDVKEQWREVAAFIEADSEVDTDVAVFCAAYIQEPFDYYYAGELERLGIDKRLTDVSQISAIVDEAVRDRERLWLIMAHGGQDSPPHRYILERYGRASVVLEEAFNNISVVLFDLVASTQEGNPR